MTTVLRARTSLEDSLGRAAVSLADVEPAFAQAIPAGEFADAQRVLRVGRLNLAAGHWRAPDGIERALALLALDGLVFRERAGDPDGHASLLGPGDLADARPLAHGLERWRVIRPTAVAVLDARLLVAGRRWPRLFAALTHRLFDAAEEQAALSAIVCLPHVEGRLLALIDHYANRWGRVTPAGRVVDLPLTHEMLGRLVGSKRPTISLALRALANKRLLARDEAGRWILPFAVDPAQRTGH